MVGTLNVTLVTPLTSTIGVAITTPCGVCAKGMAYGTIWKHTLYRKHCSWRQNGTWRWNSVGENLVCGQSLSLSMDLCLCGGYISLASLDVWFLVVPHGTVELFVAFECLHGRKLDVARSAVHFLHRDFIVVVVGMNTDTCMFSAA